ncbi:universal stress protein [Halopiger goleimassiliensis]|uniref:universal stress protein n=1 Tax=Halopiger goleimassiliensis TaxID=1293048 RepID=UPI0006781357|nr:universal stress protein [Halopiger goleimassiliensis]
MADPDAVLVPSLGRPGDPEALAYALETFSDAAVVLLAVVTPLDAPLSEGGVLERDAERTAQAREHASELVDAVDGASDRVRIETAEGRPGTVIPQYAADESVDHVVMYGHDRRTSGLVRRVLGRGVATTVVDRTAAPVTVVD